VPINVLISKDSCNMLLPRRTAHTPESDTTRDSLCRAVQ